MPLARRQLARVARIEWTSRLSLDTVLIMWLFTKRGFYSIVQKKGGEFHIRARMKQDLENLKDLAEIKRQVILTRDADYRYRLVVNQVEVVAALMALAQDIDYSNFKNCIAADSYQRKKLPALHEIWGLMAGLQKGEEKSEGD
jgi:hypothetical protein